MPSRAPAILVIAVMAIGAFFLWPRIETDAKPAKALSALPSQPADPARPVVLELFTSQGCSSCPPADRLAEDLAMREGLVVITRPVTYWDRLGWKDTLARPANTDLQRAYARRGLTGYNGVYTPQIVVNGRAGAVGSQNAAIARLTGQANSADAPTITVADSRIAVSGSAGGNATLSLVALDRHEQVSIARGENRNRTLDFTNIYLGEERLGDWLGGTQQFVLPDLAARNPQADAFALILREGEAGPILAGLML